MSSRSPGITDGTLALDGDGEVVEWILRMHRFPAQDELESIAETVGINDALADDLGVAVFAFHSQTPQRDDDGAQLIGDILDELARVFSDMHSDLGSAGIRRFLADSRKTLTQIAPLLRQRAISGHVRRGHGDLHLRNLVLIDGKPVPFDALEFDEVLGTCDVLYDLAFLIMDLHHRGLKRAANMTLNAYLLAAAGQEDAGLSALPLFLSVRAAIRAMVLVQTARATGASVSPEARTYLDEAIAFLDRAPASIVLVGGMSGTGKTAIGHALAPLFGATPGAVHLRTDTERKAMRGAAPEDKLTSAEYTPEARSLVYKQMLHRAEVILAAGHSVLLDATFLDDGARRAAEALSETSNLPLHGIWLEAPLPVLIDRVRKRRGDASDADETVVRQQAGHATRPAGWTVVSTAGSLEASVVRCASALGLSPD